MDETAAKQKETYEAFKAAGKEAGKANLGLIVFGVIAVCGVGALVYYYKNKSSEEGE